jgi:CRP-like cAMP-binding protein
VNEADFLHTLTPAESDALEEMGEPGSYPAGSVIFEQGGTPDCVLLVRGGRVGVAARGPGGDEIVLAERGPGELLGDLSGIERRLREAEARQRSG